MPVSALPAMRAAIAYSAPAAASDWWLSGGISGANAIAVYQPKGAASLAASYTNLANPGTYDAAPVVAPTWNETDGWIGNGSTTYLTTGIVPDGDWSIFARFNNLTNGASNAGIIVGSTTGGQNRRFYLWPDNGIVSAARVYGNGGTRSITGDIQEGVMGFAGSTAYLDGSSEGAITTGDSPIQPIGIMAVNLDGSPSFYAACYIQAIAIYDTTLTSDQVAAVSTAMAAL